MRTRRRDRTTTSQGERSSVALSATKLHAPHLRDGTIRRPRLTSILCDARPALALIIAPPGFGKSSLLADWADLDPRAFAWVSIDDLDDDPVVLWSYVGRAIADAAGDAANVGVPTGDIDPVGALLRGLAGIDREIVLVLDDFHRISSEPALRSVMRFVEGAPRTVQVVIASRTDPPFPVARLRASGDLLEIRAEDLRFTADETNELLNDSLELGLDGDSVELLHERTEGWPAGLYLAVLSLRASEDPRSFVESFGASNRHVLDYLTEQVLAAVEPQTLQFMLATSVVDQVCGPLADALTLEERSADRLIELEHANVFFVPLDHRREWYRYHHLLSELLRSELARRAPALVAPLHARASAWFAASGDADRAIRHAVAGGDLDRAAQLIGESYVRALEQGRIATVAAWLDLYEAGHGPADVRVLIVKAWTMHFLGRHDEGSAAIAAALQTAHDGLLPDGATSIESSAALLAAAFPGGDMAAMLAAARDAYRIEAGSASAWRISVHVLLGFALVRNGLYEEAEQQLRTGAELATEAGLWTDAVSARALRGRALLEIGQLDAAEASGREAMALAQERGIAATPSAAYARATLGGILARRSAIEEAEELLVEALPIVTILGEPLATADTLLALAEVRLAQGRRVEAMALMDEVDALIGGARDPGAVRSWRDVIAAMVAGNGGANLLSPQELEVVRLLAEGISKREVAERRFVSYNTVHSQVRAIYRKLGVASREEAVDRARTWGLLDARTEGTGDAA
ncbi:MAG: LuxR C-terminal-related transcriptional regulator [Chloroflexota bacterium]